MHAVVVILLILALVFFIVAAVVGYGPGASTSQGWHRTNFLGIGLACWVLTEIIDLVVGKV